MKTIRLLYPDYVGGGDVGTYYFGANLMTHIIPDNPAQPLYTVNLTPPGTKTYSEVDGILGKEEVMSDIRSAMAILDKERPDRVVTIGGTCLVSQAPFDYLHGLYDSLGIVWIDAHPDVSTPADGYPNAHAMVLGSLMGFGAGTMSDLMANRKFLPDEILYVGLQGLLPNQKKFLEDKGVHFREQTDGFVSNKEIETFLQRFEHAAVHLDIDVLDPKHFHSTYFANPDMEGDGSGGGRMTIPQLTEILHTITEYADVVGLTIAEYLPFNEYALSRMFAGLPILTE